MRLRVGVGQINCTVGDLEANVATIVDHARRAGDAGCDVVCFPELALCGYPPEDLLLKPAFVHDAARTLDEVAVAVGTGHPDLVAIIGTVHDDVDLYNAAAVVCGGRVVGWYHKSELPNYGVFDEKRYFATGRDAGPLLRINGILVGLTVCEDIWVPGGPLLDQARAGAQVALNINGSPYARGKDGLRRSMLSTRANDYALPLVYLNLVGGQDELVFDGGSLLFDPEGRLVAGLPRFEECFGVWDVNVAEGFRQRLRETRLRGHTPIDLPVVDLDELRHPSGLRPPPPGAHQEPPPVLGECEEVYRALVTGVRDYLGKNGFSTAVIGLSGGIDSTLTAAVAVDALGPDAVTGIAMPSPFSSGHSVEDARALVENLGIEFHIVRIDDMFAAILEGLEPIFKGTEPNVAEENVQARIRGNLLMAYSNKFGAMLLTTGNKSEMATGYATLYGDMAGGFSVLKDVPKVLVFELCRWRNAEAGWELIPQTVIDKPPSAELAPDQFDTDSLPPYEVLDPILEAYVERDMVATEIVEAGIGDPAHVAQVVRLVDLSEYKRRQAPPGVRISAKAFGRDRRLPITNRYRPRV